MNIEITYSAQHGLEWRVSFRDPAPVPRTTPDTAAFYLAATPHDEEQPTQEAAPVTAQPRVYRIARR